MHCNTFFFDNILVATNCRIQKGTREDFEGSAARAWKKSIRRRQHHQCFDQQGSSWPTGADCEHGKNLESRRGHYRPSLPAILFEWVFPSIQMQWHWSSCRFTCVQVHIVAQLEPSSQINGYVVLMDFEGLGMKQVKAMTPHSQKRLLTFIQEAMPGRLKEVHFVKQPFIFNMVWTLFKPFVKEKLKNRVRRTWNGPEILIVNLKLFLDVLPWRRHEKAPQVSASWSLAIELWWVAFFAL